MMFGVGWSNPKWRSVLIDILLKVFSTLSSEFSHGRTDYLLRLIECFFLVF